LFTSVNDTPQRLFSVPLVWLIQLVPPSVVLRIVPYDPTAVPLFASVNETPQREYGVPLGWLIQINNY